MANYNLSPKKSQKKTNKKQNRKFTKEELQEMSDYELKKICLDHKIVDAYTGDYTKEELVDTILKYRGKKKSYLIDKYKEGGVEKVQQNLIDNSLQEMAHKDEIQIPAKMIIYKELGIRKEDVYEVKVENEIQKSNVLLMNGDIYLCGIMNLVPDKNSKGHKYYLVGESGNFRVEGLQNKKYSMIFFSKSESEYIYKTYYSDGKMPSRRLRHYRVPIMNLEIRKLEHTDTVLGIDFGTSNTTVGAYLDRNYISNLAENDVLNNKIELNQINFVQFSDMGEKESHSEIIPTTVYVKNCQDPDNIEYLFGYEARKHMRKNEYTGKASLFHGIKRWVTTHGKVEEIYDEYGNTARVSRGDIIKEYIKYIVEAAEHQFKCRFSSLHISSPVKLKEQYLAIFQEILPNYEIYQEEALDEGMAVLYNTIANQMDKNNFYDGEYYKALVIDSGGGTTDLSSCKFMIKERDISYKIDIQTTFEDGDTNFGGNNITFRIMQFMKVVFAHYYQTDGEIIDIDELISIPACDIFRYVDESGLDEIYSELKNRYEQAEEIIPTRYKEYENKTSEEYRKVRNNFYFLWEIAENMKKRFFERTNILRNKFDSSDISSEDSDLHITRLRKWSLSLRKGSQLETLNTFPKVVFNIKAINKLIKADIYAVVKDFLEELYESRKLMEYSIIKLTGQSCKIDIFKEALKEFVAGRSIKFKQKRKQGRNKLNLKLSCLKGVLKYLKSKRFGQIEVNIENDDPNIPYSVTGYTFSGEEKTIIDSHKKVTEAVGTISKPSSVQEVKFVLKRDGIIHKEYTYKNNLNEYSKAEVQNVSDEYEKIDQKDTDTIRNGEIKFFLFSNSEKWGFHVLPILRKEDQLLIGRREYYPFDYEVAEMNFFDGLQ